MQASSTTLKWLMLIGIPLAFYLCGGIGKMIIRGGSQFWDRRDWYLAADATLASMASGMMHIAEVISRADESPVCDWVSLVAPALMSVAAFLILYLIIVVAHQKLEHQRDRVARQRNVLVVGCNAGAILGMVVFIVCVKGM